MIEVDITPGESHDSPNYAAISRAMKILRERRGHLFLTGRAGTGKTYFLDRARKELADTRNIAVVAPSGVAAIKARGKTIHSFFRIRPQAYAPGGPQLTTGFWQHFRYTAESREVIKALDLLIIDEVSMVRADLLDVIDTVLRKVRNQDTSFGGVQVCLIGDAFQLPPVVTDKAERALLSDHYSSHFFFSAHCFDRPEWTAVELPTVMRQRDKEFVNILNRIRVGETLEEDLELLNTKFIGSNSTALESTDRVLLTAKRAEVDQQNHQALLRLSGPPSVFEATVSGQFSERDFPTVKSLHLKHGALVMFLKNDPEGAYYNGRLGVVSEIGQGSVTVTTEVGQPVEITRNVWENIKYTYDREARRLREESVGTFTQFPLRLAYAITIHKSQGLTIDRAMVDLSGAFQPGMAYVALSRLRNFNGLSLTTPISNRAIMVSPEAVDFQKWVDGEQSPEQAGGFTRRSEKLTPRFPPPPNLTERTDQPPFLEDVPTSGPANDLAAEVIRLREENASLRRIIDRIRGALDEDGF